MKLDAIVAVIFVALFAATAAAQEPCVDNITAAVEDVAAAADAIGEAVIDCGAHNTAKCVSDISSCAADVAAAGVAVSLAVEACGGRGSTCATDLLQLGKELAQTSSDVALAASYCTNSTDILECIADVVDIAGAVEKIVVDIEGAVRNCRGNSTA